MADENAPIRTAPSKLARLQQAITLTAVVVLIVAAHAAVTRGSLLAWLIVVAVLTGHAGILALEMATAARVGASDPAPIPVGRDWARAWWRESLVAPRVFAWRQPFRWREHPDAQSAGDPALPVAVFVHGFVCNRGFWAPWMLRMRASQQPYVSVNLEPVFGGIEHYSAIIERAVQRAEALNPHEKPLLICHSMGGLVARAWLVADERNRDRTRGVITIASPHRGTWLAKFSRARNGRQMAPGGDWLMGLERRERQLAGPEAYQGFVCWYTHTDNIVFPASTATLPGADNRHVPASGHVDLAFHPTVMDASLASLASAGSSPKTRTAS